MKRTYWVKLVFIFYVLVTVIRLGSNTLELKLMPANMSTEVTGQVIDAEFIQTKYTLAVLGFVVNALCFLGALTFLIQKFFSARFVLIAMIIRLTFLIGSSAYQSRYPVYFENYVLNIVTYINLGIDLLMVLLVFAILKKGFHPVHSTEAVASSAGYGRAISLLSLTLISYPAYSLVMWYLISSREGDFRDHVNEFKSIQPDFISSNNLSSQAGLICCILSIILSAIIIQKLSVPWKVLNSLVLVVAVSMLMLLLFQLM